MRVVRVVRACACEFECSRVREVVRSWRIYWYIYHIYWKILRMCW